MLFPGPQQSVFWFDFESLTDANLYRDLGPNGLHATPGAAMAAPNYGLARNAHGKGYVAFTGGVNSCARLSGTAQARFYTVAPAAEHTWVFIQARQTITGIAPRVFSCELFGANNFGIATTTLTTDNPGRVWAANYGGAGVRFAQTPAGSLLLMPEFPVIFTMEANPKAWIDRSQVATSWAAGAYGAPVYNAATVPTIGQDPSGGGTMVARLYFLALFPFVFTDQEAKTMIEWLMDQV